MSKRSGINPTFNVKNFGATGNGSSDDTAAVQAALTAAVAANASEVFFPKGTYRVSTLTITSAVGLRLRGASRFTTRLLCSNLTTDMLTLTNSTMCEIQDFEIYLTGQKTAGSFIKLDNAQLTRIRNVRMQNPYVGLFVTNNSSGMFSELDFVPQNSAWPWNAAILLRSAAGLYFSNINVNFGVCVMQDAAIVVDSGVDTAIFTNVAANQIGGTPGGATGGKAFSVKHSLSPGSFEPRWVKVVNGLFEGGADVGINIEAGNNVELVNAYSVTSKNGLKISGGNSIKVYGGTFANISQHGINITGGTDILLHGVTVTACSLQVNNTYSGILVDPGAVRVKIINPIVGDVTTIPGATNVMANGIALTTTANSNNHSVVNPTFGALVSNPIFRGVAKAAYRIRTETENTAIPTTGTWELGDVVYNSAPTPGAPGGWGCTAAGTPGTWTPFARLDLDGSVTWTPPSLAAGATQTTTVTVTGAALGDFVLVSFSLSTGGTKLVGHVTAANTVTVFHTNPTGAAVALASGTLRARVIK